MRMNMRGFITLLETPVSGDVQTWLEGSEVTEPVFHQTHRDNIASIRTNGFDLNRIGARGSEDTLPNGIYFKPDSRNIGVGSHDDAAQMEFYIRLRNPLVVHDRGELLALLRRDPEYDRLKQMSDDADHRIARAAEKLEALEDASRTPGQRVNRDFFPKFEKLFAQGERLTKRLAGQARARCTAWLRQQGYDGLIVQRDVGSFGRTTTTYVVLDTANIRPAGEALTESAEAVDTKGNWKVFQGLPDDAIVRMYHATSRKAAEAILSGGFDGSRKVWRDSTDGYIYLGSSPGGLGIYGAHAASRDGDVPAILAVDVRKGDIEPDAGKDWQSYLRNPSAKRDVANLHGKAAVKSPSAAVTLAEIGQARAPVRAVTPVAVLDADGRPFA
jgi:hypothetical protein